MAWVYHFLAEEFSEARGLLSPEIVAILCVCFFSNICTMVFVYLDHTRVFKGTNFMFPPYTRYQVSYFGLEGYCIILS